MLVALSGGADGGSVEEIIGIVVFFGSGLAMHSWFNRRWRRRAEDSEDSEDV